MITFFKNINLILSTSQMKSKGNDCVLKATFAEIIPEILEKAFKDRENHGHSFD